MLKRMAEEMKEDTPELAGIDDEKLEEVLKMITE